MSINHKNPTKVVTGVVRLSYANVWEPASINGSNPKYSVSLIIPKTDTKTIDAINAAVDAAIKDGAAKFGGKIPNKAALKLPLRDGDLERDDEAYKGAYFVNANSTTAPQIVDRSVQPILDRAEVYSGCYHLHQRSQRDLHRTRHRGLLQRMEKEAAEDQNRAGQPQCGRNEIWRSSIRVLAVFRHLFRCVYWNHYGFHHRNSEQH